MTDTAHSAEGVARRITQVVIERLLSHPVPDGRIAIEAYIEGRDAAISELVKPLLESYAAQRVRVARVEEEEKRLATMIEMLHDQIDALQHIGEGAEVCDYITEAKTEVAIRQQELQALRGDAAQGETNVA